VKPLCEMRMHGMEGGSLAQLPELFGLGGDIPGGLDHAYKRLVAQTKAEDILPQTLVVFVTFNEVVIRQATGHDRCHSCSVRKFLDHIRWEKSPGQEVCLPFETEPKEQKEWYRWHVRDDDLDDRKCHCLRSRAGG
jgi:hypothetical protein